MPQVGSISESLEDYLKIIFELEQERRVARVKDIAMRKGVRMASVTGALRRMAREGLVNYGAREFVELTEQGAEIARKILQRAQFLSQFMQETLGLGEETARRDADAIEHSLSPETLARLVALFQFMDTYGHKHLLAAFFKDGISVPCTQCPNAEAKDRVDLPQLRPLIKLAPGASGEVVWLRGDEKRRLELVERGILPRETVTMEAVQDGQARIRIKGSTVSLTREQARAVQVIPLPG